MPPSDRYTMPQHKILIIEEAPHTHSVISERLHAEGFATLACSPNEALTDVVRAHGVGVALLITRQRGPDGYTIASELRHHTGSGVIVLGDSDDEVEIALALEMGADDYVTMPVRPRELCARIRTVLRRTIVTPADDQGARPLPDHFLRQVSDLEICGVQRRVRVGGRDVELTTLEFDVLMVLAANTNAVLSRDRITRAARGRDWSVNDRAIDGIVSRLRKKLFEEGEGARRIRTVTGRGYMLLE